MFMLVYHVYHMITWADIFGAAYENKQLYIWCILLYLVLATSLKHQLCVRLQECKSHSYVSAPLCNVFLHQWFSKIQHETSSNLDVLLHTSAKMFQSCPEGFLDSVRRGDTECQAPARLRWELEPCGLIQTWFNGNEKYCLIMIMLNVVNPTCQQSGPCWGMCFSGARKGKIA